MDCCGLCSIPDAPRTPPPGTAVLITAAGSGTRMGGGAKKELAGDRPPLLVLLELFAEAGYETVVVTHPAGRRADFEDLARRVPAATGILTLVEGGSERQESVFRGLLALEASQPGIVLIHDGARPSITPGLCAALAWTAAEHGACAPAIPSRDAMKTLAPDGTIRAHLDRGTTWAVQTPQAFRFDRILAAHRQAAGDGRAYIDDTEIWAGYVGEVRTIRGLVRNSKITYPCDIR